MKELLKTACAKSHYVSLFIFTMVASLLCTFAGQLEVFSLGIVTKKGPDFFELFSPVVDGKLTTTPTITKQAFDERFETIDSTQTGVITHAEVNQFLATHKKNGLIDTILEKVNKFLPIETSVSYLIIALVLVALFKAITLFFWKYGTRVLSIKISRDLRKSYFEHLQMLPMSFYQEHNIGSLSSRVVTDATMIADGINSALINYLQTPFALLTTLTLCFIISWQLSVVVFFGLPLLVVPIIFLARRIKRISKLIQKKQEAFGSVLVEFLSGIQTIKIFAMEDFSLKKYNEDNEAMANLERKSARYDVSARPILHTIGIFCLITALLFGLYGLQLPLYDVLVYCGLLSTVYEPIKKFAEENGRIQRGVAASERMSEVLTLHPQDKKIEDSLEITQFTSSIEFKNVSFAYGDKWVLKNVSFSVNKGEKIAICGPTGAGKSTIVQLLPRLYDAQSGEILIDGVPITRYSQRSLRDLLGFVPQKPFLFFDTVRENISFGRNFSDVEIVDAANKAHAAEFIEKLPQGYNTLLLEAGKSLSGGQQQRIAIARAFVKKSPILIMDEATSSLDAASEEQIKEALKAVRGQTTQIIIAHRLSTIEDADRIIYIEHGEKIAEGTKEELLEHCPPFRIMWDLLHLHK